MKIFILISTTLFALQSHAKFISDSFVQNLNCKTLSAEQIFSSMRKEVLAPRHHLPVENWSFSYLGACWSLSHAQRLVFLLGHLDHGAFSDPDRVRKLLNSFRRSEPYAQSLDRKRSPIKEWPIEYEVFVLAEPLAQSSLWQMLEEGFIDNLGAGVFMERNFKSEIEFYQIQRFHDPANLPMGLGSWQRPKNENEESYRQLINQLTKNRPSLVNLRADQMVQHVVLVKDIIEQTSERTVFRVYDSNFPLQENSFEFRHATQEFHAGSIFEPWYGTVVYERPIGLFIVDEKDYSDIDKALLKYYRQKCF